MNIRRCRTCNGSIVWAEADGEWFHHNDPPRSLYPAHPALPAKELACTFCGMVFETRRQQWDHTPSCAATKQALRDLRVYAGVEDDDAS